MENASKALIMSGSILIGVIILSIATYLFATFGSHSKEIQEQVDARVIAEFNNNFTKYQGNIRCTIHDIVNCAKFAQKVNEQMDVQDGSDFYIHVYLQNNNPKELTTNYSEEGTRKWTDLISKNLIGNYTDDNGNPKTDTKYYTCEDVQFENGQQSNRVSGIVFRETKDGELKAH